MLAPVGLNDDRIAGKAQFSVFFRTFLVPNLSQDIRQSTVCFYLMRAKFQGFFIVLAGDFQFAIFVRDVAKIRVADGIIRMMLNRL